MSEDGYSVVSLSFLISHYGDVNATSLLKTFNPYVDEQTSDYLSNKAIPMEKRDLSRTYLTIDNSNGKLLGFVTIGMKCLRIPRDNLLSRKILKQCNIEESTGVAQAYLLGQLARSNDSPKGFGKVLVEFAINKLRDAKGIVGCRIARLDCSDDLIDYYQKNGFNLISKNDSMSLNQMLIVI